MKGLLVIAGQSAVVQVLRPALRHAPSLRVLGLIDGRSSARAWLAELRPALVLIDELSDSTYTLARLHETYDQLPSATRVVLVRDLDRKPVDRELASRAHALIARDMDPAAL